MSSAAVDAAVNAGVAAVVASGNSAVNAESFQPDFPASSGGVSEDSELRQGVGAAPEAAPGAASSSAASVASLYGALHGLHAASSAAMQDLQGGSSPHIAPALLLLGGASFASSCAQHAIFLMGVVVALQRIVAAPPG